jgi:2-amino-4-hydroxy-6-hydroxymethyldihydropteridine diphosphokinase
MPPVRTFVGLGSNLGDRFGFLAAASDELARLGQLTARSPVYETAPVGPPQPDYLNAVVELQVDLAPEALLESLLRIERGLGRLRRERWGPRTIDLDLLAMDGVRLSHSTLTLPHPEISRRAFVLRPWLEIAPDYRVPGAGTVSEMWDALPAEARASVRVAERSRPD